MSQVYFSSADSLLTIIQKIKTSSEGNLALQIPKDNIFWQSPANRQLLEKIAQTAGKTLAWQQEQTEEQVSPSEGELKEPTPTPTKKRRRGKWVKIGLILFVIFALLMGTALAFVYYYLPKATIILQVEEKTLERLEQIWVMPDLAEPVLPDAKLPGHKLSVTETEGESFAATGQETVGEKAVGVVSLQNWTDSPATVAAGTQLTVLPNQTGVGLHFLTTEGVAVPAQTKTSPEPGKKLYEAGVANVKIEAEKFGEDYNLAANTQFSLANQGTESFLATNANQLLGGTTRQITVISPDDLTRSSQQLSSKLFTQGKIDLESKLVGDQKLIETLLENKVVQETPSAQIGEEIDKFDLKMTTQSTALAYSDSELKSIILAKLAGLIPEGYRISSEQKAISIQAAKENPDGVVELTVKIKTLVIPDLDLEQLKSALLGKKPPAAVEVLTQNKQILNYQIQTWPVLPEFLRILPHRSERLIIEIKTE